MIPRVASFAIVITLSTSWGCSSKSEGTTGTFAQVPSTGRYVGTAPEDPAPKKDNARQPEPAPKQEQPIEVTAQELGKETLARDSGVDAKYSGKTVRVKGTVSGVLGEYVYLGTSFRFPEGQPVKIALRFSNDKIDPKITAGSVLTIEGSYSGMGVFGPGFRECRLIAIVEKKILTVTATELTKAYEEDGNAAKKKYLSGELIIEGSVKKISLDGDGDITVELAGHEFYTVTCFISKKNAQQFKSKVKEGQVIKLKGSWNSSSTEPFLSNAALME